MTKITINGISVNPQMQFNELKAIDAISPDSSDTNYILIQTAAPLDKAQKEQLAALGVEILEYVPTQTYICRYLSADLDAVRALPFVEWANNYLQEFKIAPQLISPDDKPNNLNLLAASAASMPLSPEPKKVDIVLHQNVSADQVREEIARAAGLDPEDLKISDGKVRLRVSQDNLEKLAKIDEVRHIEEVVPNKLFNNVALDILQANQVHSTGLEGTGQIIAVCDTGFDKGSETNVHPDFAGRVLKLYALGGRNKANDPNGHGTHVAGSVLGSGNSASMGGAIRGAAPKAKLVLQSVLDPDGGLGGLPPDLTELFRVPYEDDNARVHTNSWGSAVAGRYTRNSFEVDNFVWKNRDFVICFAAGNDGSDRNSNGVIDGGSIGSPATAKNCITVGASENNRPAMSKQYGVWTNKYPVDPIASDLWADNPQGMAAFSSRGPTQDGRIKPDIVAPGTAILSTLSRDAAVGDFWGTSTDSLYCFMGGTSMATPLVAGCVAVIREYFERQHNHSPSAALVKAMLINGANDLSGQYVPSEAGAIPNFSEGFGRVDLENTVTASDNGVNITFRDEDLKLDTGEDELSRITIDTEGKRLKVTLVWTDPPGEALQNDLDLIVLAANGDERHGNIAADSNDFDRKNNVESVVWDNIPAGDVEIIVRAHRVALHPQSYALVIRVA